MCVCVCVSVCVCVCVCVRERERGEEEERNITKAHHHIMKETLHYTQYAKSRASVVTPELSYGQREINRPTTTTYEEILPQSDQIYGG